MIEPYQAIGLIPTMWGSASAKTSAATSSTSITW